MGPVLPSYLRSGFHCAIGDSSPGFGKGEQCGLCYKLTSLNDNGVAGTPGSKGSAVVMVSNGGAGGEAHFDCILESFKEITGAETGIFDVEFEQVRCDDVTGGPVVINWADQNAHYCKMMFENIGSWGNLDRLSDGHRLEHDVRTHPAQPIRGDNLDHLRVLGVLAMANGTALRMPEKLLI